jgi:hypothetical protein
MEVTKPLTAQCRRTALRPIHLDVLTAPNLNRIPHAFLQTKSAAQGRAVFFFFLFLLSHFRRPNPTNAAKLYLP